MQDLADLLSWTSAAGIARLLHVNRSLNEGCAGFTARSLLVLLVLLPLALGLAEIILGIIHRQSPAGCPFPLPVWVIVDGVAALVTVALSLLDIAFVHRLSRERLDDDDDSTNGRASRARALGTYAALGVVVVFFIPLFRLVWILYGLDILYSIGACVLRLSLRLRDCGFMGRCRVQRPAVLLAADPGSFRHFYSASLQPGACSATLFSFMWYYIEAVTLLLLLLLAITLVLAVVVVVVQVRTCSQSRVGGGSASGSASKRV